MYYILAERYSEGITILRDKYKDLNSVNINDAINEAVEKFNKNGYGILNPLKLF